MPLPKPPVSSMADFVVFCFTTIVVFILVASTVGVLINAVTNPNDDQSAITTALGDIVRSLIAALVGFIAGKGSGRAEAQEEQVQRDLAEKDKAREHEERIKARGQKLG